MKTCNILVSENEETWDFYLLDLEDIRLDEKVDEESLFKNLLQLNTSIPKTMTRTDRLRFLKEYLRQQPVIRDVKNLIVRLVKNSRKRGIVYVSPQGVIVEKWS
jgi:MoxR-like ATPase